LEIGSNRTDITEAYMKPRMLIIYSIIACYASERLYYLVYELRPKKHFNDVNETT